MQDLTWWQGFGLVVAAAASFFGGRFLGLAVYRVLYRHLLMSTGETDDRIMFGFVGPLQAFGVVIVWQIGVSLFELPPDVLEVCRAIGHVGLLGAIAWGLVRGVDASFEMFAPRWVRDQRPARSLLPLARRITKVVVVAVIALMVLARLGFSIGPLLVLFAVVGVALALAAVRPLENVIAAYAIMGDHGIREGDTIRLDARVSGVIESIGLYSTRIRTSDESHVIVPNRRLADAEIERAFHRPPTQPYGTVRDPDDASYQTRRETLS